MIEPQIGSVANRNQFAHQLLQVLLVGLTLGMVRTVVPALAESEFGVPRGSILLLSSFVVAFGLVKGVLNFVAGRLSERVGRKPVLLAGWVAAVPVPFLIYFAPSWSWIVAVTVLLGVGLRYTKAAVDKRMEVRLSGVLIAVGNLPSVRISRDRFS